MSRISTFLAVLIAALLAPVAAAADPVTAAIATFLSVSTATATFILRIGISLAMSALQSALQKNRGGQRQPGIKTEATTTGGDNAQTFVLGKYATAGNMAAPPYSHPNDGGSPNEYLTYVVDIADMPGVTFSRIMVAGEYIADLSASAGDHDLEGMLYDVPGVGEDVPHLFMTWHDGSQVSADAYMMANYADHPDRPWSADMVGTGLSYVVLTFRYNREVFNNLPGVLLEVQGVPLYDPRADSTVGGSGGQLWADPDTWAPSDNPAVMIYNILRGITLPDGKRWGGAVAAEDLPLDSWFAAMNECDLPVSLAAGGTQPQYRAGLEVGVDQEPAAVIEELLKACAGDIAEVGGIYKMRAGAPALPVYFITDDDVVADQPQSLTPYPGLDQVHNAVAATYPAPAALWQTRDAPPRYNAEWEAEDGGRQLVAQVDLPAVPYGLQVQRLMRAWIEDERRFRRHGLTLPPDAAALEPLDCVSWTSAREGYTSKVFELGEMSDDMVTCLQTVAMREREPGDFSWTPAADEIAIETPSTVLTRPAPRVVPGFSVMAFAMRDGAGSDRRPALLLSWSGSVLAQTDVIRYQVELSDATPVAAGTFGDALAGQMVVSEGILPLTSYRVRAILRARQGAIWTAWQAVTTGDLRLVADDLADTLTVSGVPSGLALSSALVSDGLARVTASWGGAAGAVSYEVEISENGGGAVVFPVGGTSHRIDALRGSEYAVRVRGVSAIGEKSAWSAQETITAAVDTEAPAVPSGVSVIGTFNAFWLEWEGVTDADLDHYEVCASASSAPLPESPTDPVFTTASDAFVWSGQADALTRYFSVRAVDTSGNASGWSAPVGATTRDPALTGVTTADLVEAVDSTSFAAGITGVEIVDVLPTYGNFQGRQAVLTTNGKLYRFHLGAWTSTVPATDVSGQMTSAQIAALDTSKLTGTIGAALIAAGAIGTEALAAKSVTVRHMTVGDFENLLVGGDFEDAENIPWDTSGLANMGLSISTYHSGTQGLYIGPAAGVAYSDRLVEVQEGDEFYLSCWAIKSSQYDGAIGSTKIRISNAAGDYIAELDLSVANTSWTKHEKFFTVPAGVSRLSTQLFFTSGTTGGIWLDDIQMRRRGGGELIVDGAIKAAHLYVDSVTTGAIAAGAVKAAQIDTGAVTAAKLSVGDFTNLWKDPLNEDDSYCYPEMGTVTYKVADPAHKSVNLVEVEAPAGQYGIGMTGEYFDIDPDGEEFHVQYYADIEDGTTGACFIQIIAWPNADHTGTAVAITGPSVTTTNITRGAGNITVPAGYVVGRLRLVKGSSGANTRGRFGKIHVHRKNAGKLIVDGSIHADLVDTHSLMAAMADINVAFINEAHITGTINANKITGGTALLNTITVDGTALGTTTARSDDPAARVNAKATTINPGKIEISGSTTLADWRKGGDETRIDGGALSANTVEANKLTIGNRGVSVQNVKFEADASTDTVSWTAGGVRYVGDAGASTFRSVAAGSIAYTGVRIYVYFTKGSDNLQGSSDPTLAGTGDNVIVATYNGGNDLTVNYGQTVIDGDHIQTGSVGADHVAARSISTDKLVVGDATNLLDGADFEDVTRCPWPLDSGYSLGVISYSGAQSLRIGSSAAINSLKRLSVPVIPGERYRFSGWFRRNADWDGDANYKVRISNAADTSSIQQINYGVGYIDAADTWEYKTREFVIPAGVIAIRVDLWAGVASAGFAYLDDLRLHRMTDGALIVNGTLQADKVQIDNVTLDTDGNGTLIVGAGGVDTAQLADGAVSASAIFSRATDKDLADYQVWTQVASSGITAMGGRPLSISGALLLQYYFADATETILRGELFFQYRIKVDGVVAYTSPIMGTSAYHQQTALSPIPISYRATSAAGTTATTIEVYIYGYNAGTVYFDFTALTGTTLQLLELKR